MRAWTEGREGRNVVVRIVSKKGPRLGEFGDIVFFQNLFTEFYFGKINSVAWYKI